MTHQHQQSITHIFQNETILLFAKGIWLNFHGRALLVVILVWMGVAGFVGGILTDKCNWPTHAPIEQEVNTKHPDKYSSIIRKVAQDKNSKYS